MKAKTIICLSLLLLIPIISASAQTANEDKKKEQAAASAQSDPQAGMKARIFEIKYKNAESIADAIRALISRGGYINANRDLRTVTVRDFPENLAVIEEAIKRLDTPETPQQPRPARANFEVQLHLIATSKTPAEKGSLPAGLEPVIHQLQETLKYKGYRLITTILNRAEEYGKVEGSGITDALFPLPSDSGRCFYSYILGGFNITTDAAGRESIQMNRFYFAVKTPIVIDGKGSIQYQDAKIETSLSLREGEKVVVGTANLGVSDEAVIAVVSVRKLK